MKKALVTVAAMLLVAAGVVVAQDSQPNPSQVPEPSTQQDTQDTAQDTQAAPGVGHVSFIHGEVSTRRGDSGDWVAATLNTPVVNGDTVSTAGGSRAEVQLDYANLIRLDQNSQAKVVDLSRDHIQLQVGQGLVNYDLLRGNGANAEVDTPNMAVHPLREGSYRIEVVSDSETRVIVRSGEAQVSTPQGSTNVEAGQMITIEGTDNPQYQTASAPNEDEWDRFNRDRDRKIMSAKSWRHTDRYYAGTQDLDAYGHWEQVPDYGSVWVPAEPAGWAPYRSGRWVWEPYYGWTWVSYEPWGWAPYHYGRWFVYDNDWCWWPGPVAVYPAYYPIWAPAYVSFFGFGGGGFGVSFGFGFGFGSIGWLPIGPGDFFHPWWGRFGNRVNIVNITNININNFHGGMSPLFHRGGVRGFSNLDHAFNNARVRGGISTMGASMFGRAAVPRAQRGMDAGTFRQASMITGRVPVVPTHQSLQSVNRSPASETMHGRAGNQHFFGTPRSSFTPRPFGQQATETQRAIQSSRNGFGNRGSSGSFSQTNRANTTSFGQTNRGNMGSFGHANRGNAATSAGSARPGWHSFGGSSVGARSGVGTQVGRPISQPSRADGGASRTVNRANMGSFGHANRSGVASSAGNARPGWHSFGANSGGARSGQGTQMGRPASQPNRGFGSRSMGPSSQGSGSGWHGFQGQRNSSGSARSQMGSADRSQPAASRGRNWRNFTQPSSRPSYGGSEPRGREPLNMRQPIVNQRSYSPYGGGSRGGYYGGNGMPSNGGSRSYSPSYGGGRSYGGGHSYSPSYGGSRGYSGGGGHSYSGGGGGGRGYSGGGGGHSSGGSHGGGGGRGRH